MLDRLEGYTDDELDEIADENENWDPSGQGDTPADASEGMRLFIADFDECTDRARRGADRHVGADRFDRACPTTDATARPRSTGTDRARTGSTDRLTQSTLRPDAASCSPTTC